MRTPQIHYLAHNKSERSPRRCVFVDTETSWEDDGELERHHLRLWVARLVIRDGDPRHTIDEAWHTGRTGEEFRKRLEAWSRTSATLWVFAHNLTFDLCTTRILSELLRHGWELGEHALANDSPWARLKRGNYRITLADSASWLPRSIEHLGALVRIPKPDLPANDDDEAAWLDRCRGDVDILSTAMTELLDTWDRERLGCWSVTGTATGWNAYRHHPNPTRVVIDPDPAPRVFERQAIVAGRRDAWRLGPQPEGRTVLIDLERAHLTAAREFDLPARRGRDRGPDAIDDWPQINPTWEPMLDCVVRTAVPRYPWRHCDRVWYPVGSFRTTLAGPEVREALRRGELQRVLGGRLYLLKPVMRPWARWLTGVLDGDGETLPPSFRLWAKMCSQRVCGKWAARTSRPLEPYLSDRMGWALDLGILNPDGVRLHTIHLDGVAHPMAQDQEAEDAFPAVLAWIQSHVRVALGRLIDALDQDRIVSCNTDGVLYRAPVDPDLASLERATHPFVPRIKAVYQNVDVLGAAHLVLDGNLKLSGVPSSASPTGETSLAWETWPRMRRQLELAQPDGYTREHREVNLQNVPVPRWVLADNTTRPIMTTVDSLGTTRILPFVPGVTGTTLPELAEHQHPVLTELLTEAKGLTPLTLLG
jgi:hypothetical protein